MLTSVRDMGRIEGKVAVVTGGADGIGAGVVRRFAEEGARVLIADIDVDQGNALASSLNGVEFMRVDVCQRSDNEAMIARAVEVFGGMDILVNNAWGGGTMARVELKTPEALQHGFDMAFYAAYWSMRASFVHMKARGWGRVVNMCSLNGVNAHIGTLEYNVGKEALRTLTRTAAREWAPTGVTVNAVCPGAKSAAFRRVMSQNPDMEKMADAGNPMGRIGDPYDDIAPVVLFLSSDDCRYVTGNTLFVDGGSHINGYPWAPALPDE